MSCEPGCPGCARLRTAALQIVGDGGIEALSATSLAARARVAPEDVKAHYPQLAACLYDSHEEQATNLVQTLVAAFEDSDGWQPGYERCRARLLAWLSAHRAGARLIFVEALRGDRELRQRRDLVRRRIVELFTDRYSRCANGNALPLLQLELLLGANFRLIAGAISAQDSAEMAQLDQRLSEVETVFVPAPA